MNDKSVWTHYFLIVLVLLLTACSRPQRGDLIDQWETNNNAFKIRVSEYDEKGVQLHGAYYVFEAAPLNSSSWQPVMSFRHDDQVGIQKDQVRFIDQRTGYAFMGWMFAITRDGSSSWKVWDAGKDLSGWECCSYRLIRDVNIAPDGTGIMKLNPISQRKGEVPELRTQDYGQHWSTM